MSGKTSVETVIVVGAGIMGLSLSWALAKRGVKVRLFDQGPIPNPVSSSFDEHRINRHAYGKLNGYARLMPDAFRAWDALWADLGVRHYEETGGIYVLRHEDDWYDNTTRQLAELGVPCKELSATEVADRLPVLNPDGIFRAVEVGGSGLLFPRRILTDLVVHLTLMGVELNAFTPVQSVDPEAGKITTDKGVEEADKVIVAAGAWISRLVPELDGVAVPSRQAVLYLAPPPTLMKSWQSAPVVVVREKEAGLYCLPPRCGTRLKIGDHRFSLTGNPDEDRMATDDDIAPIWAAMQKAYRNVDDYRIIDPKACFYTVTDDETFRLVQPGARGFAISACSGHGFKLAPLIASGVVQAVLEDRPTAEVATWAAGLEEQPLPLF
ncbi:NAD(P)/FAD-dependent oxidoreductase [Celeribacter persicus]|uniref:Sarcosine oxidase/sarcosine oxidase subunit beta n=1 Tax=Celeribacter persicus TaxID=1651082 RepID=A0A2T5HUN6_9RHOB|nr:FAD-dependent oxidoreductase [Celeribacter persicus]PTQ75303.1 sarcosine oxidase/sarcosine oxidase subunit beta [Celeribacter persicus]